MDRRVNPTLLPLILSVIYVPGYLGAYIPTGWALLSATLPVATWNSSYVLATLFQQLGIGFLAYALLSLYWTPDQYSGVFALWQYFCISFALLYGAKQSSLEGIAKGLAIGLSISSVVAVAQALGYTTVLAWGSPSGLLFNSAVLAECAAVTLVLLASYKLWWWIPGLTPSILLPGSKGVFAVLVLVTAAFLNRWLFLLAVAALVIAGCLTHSDSVAIRASLWTATVSHLSLFGSGIGSMSEVLIFWKGQPYAPEYAHNEFLDLAYQFGLFALAPILLLLAPLLSTKSTAWPAYVTAIAIACYSFPLHTPLPAFLLACLAGYALRDWSLVRVNLLHSRYGLLRRNSNPQWPANPPSGANLPV